MFDVIVKNGTVVTPHGVGAWDIGIVGEQVGYRSFRLAVDRIRECARRYG